MLLCSLGYLSLNSNIRVWNINHSLRVEFILNASLSPDHIWKRETDTKREERRREAGRNQNSSLIPISDLMFPFGKHLSNYYMPGLGDMGVNVWGS